MSFSSGKGSYHANPFFHTSCRIILSVITSGAIKLTDQKDRRLATEVS